MKIGLLGDLHIGNSKSKWEDASKIINQIAPDLDAIILIGDITEECNPYPETRNNFNNNFDKLKLKIQAIMKNFTESIKEHINKTVFLRGNHDDQVINNMDIVENYAILRTKHGRVMVFHGHQTNLATYATSTISGERIGWGVRAGREVKKNINSEHYMGVKLDADDFLIMGHCHVAYLDTVAKIFSPGCWIGNYKNNNVGWYIIINDEDIESPKDFIRMTRIPTSYNRRCKCGYHKPENSDQYCPVCNQSLICNRLDCSLPIRGEDDASCKDHLHDDFKFYE